MAWETRRNGRSYYYRKERTDGGVRSVYVGSDAEPLAHLYSEAAQDEARMDAARRRIAARTLAPLDAMLAAVATDADRLRPVRDLYLFATGHARHRGQWRRRRGLDLPPFALPPPDMAKTPDRPDPFSVEVGRQTALVIDEAVPPELAREIEKALETCRKAETKGDRTGQAVAAEVARRAMLRLPAGAFRPVLNGVTLETLAGALGAKNPGLLAVAMVETQRLADSLGAPSDSALVRGACEVAARASLALHIAEMRYHQTLGRGESLALVDSLDKRATSAQLRYVRAVATVAKLREVEGRERRRADRHGLAMEAARREMPARGKRPALPPARPALPVHANESLVTPIMVDLSASESTD